MADITPEDARNDPEKAREALNEDTGASVDGDTPPAEGLGVGPTNPGLDVEGPRDGAKAKFWLVLIGGLIALFVVLWVVGAIIGIL